MCRTRRAVAWGLGCFCVACTYGVCVLLLDFHMWCMCLPRAGVLGAMQRGVAQLPDLHVSDSSEAMLSGRKPPFRLLVRAVATDGRTVNIRHAVSEGFVVSCLPALDVCLFCHARACS